MLNKYKVTFLLAFNEVVKLKQDFIVEARDKEQANDKALKKIASNNPESIKDVKKELIPECEITRIELLERGDDEVNGNTKPKNDSVNKYIDRLDDDNIMG